MKHRVFIAINLPEDIKKRLVFYQEKIEELFTPLDNCKTNLTGFTPSFQRAERGLIKWTKKDNLHITLDFLGYVADDELLEICQNTRELAAKHKPFFITLNKICYGPPKKIPPKMIWATGERIKELDFSPHITLGRIKTWEFKQIEPEERPEVNEEIDLNFEVNSIEVMESQLKREGPEYTILESIQFRKRGSGAFFLSFLI